MIDTTDQPDTPINLSGHMPPLDGLRGLALLMVLVYHSALVSFRPTSDQMHKLDFYYNHLAGLGWSGVDLFFVLSGFLITGILIDAKGRQGYFRNFYMRRVLRIFPLYYALLLVVFFLLAPLLAALQDPPEALLDSFYDPSGSGWWYFGYVSNFYAAKVGYLGGPVGESNRALAVLWSLAIEEQFYMVWPLVLYLVPRGWLPRVCLWVIIVAVASRAVLLLAGAEWFGPHALPTAVYVLPFCRMDALAIGALVAVLGRRAGGIEALRGVGWCLSGLGLAWVVGCLAVHVVKSDLHLTSSRSMPMQTVGYTLLALGFAGGLILLLNTRRGPVRWLSTCWPLTQVGKVSYGMYLFHVPLLYALAAYGFKPTLLPKIAGLWFPAQILFTLAILVTTYALALVSWHAFEKHLLKLKRRFPSGVPAHAAQAPASSTTT